MYSPPRDLDSKATLTIGDQAFNVDAQDLEPVVLLGRGAYGVVEKMRHRPSETMMAVKVSHAHVSYVQYIRTRLLRNLTQTRDSLKNMCGQGTNYFC